MNIEASKKANRHTCPSLEGQEPEEQNRIFNGDTGVDEGSIQTKGHERHWNRWFEELCKNPNVELETHPIPSLNARRRLQVFLVYIAKELKLPIDCICTAVAYIMRCYKLIEFDESFSKKLAMTALFLAGKAMGNYRKAEYVIKVTHAAVHKSNQYLDVRSEEYQMLKADQDAIESFLLAVIGLTEELEAVIVRKSREAAAESSRIAAREAFYCASKCCGQEWTN